MKGKIVRIVVFKNPHVLSLAEDCQILQFPWARMNQKIGLVIGRSEPSVLAENRWDVLCPDGTIIDFLKDEMIDLNPNVHQTSNL